MTTHNKNVPALRFSEFSEDWEEKRLGEMADVKTGPFGSTLHQHDYVAIGTPIITVEHLNELGITQNNLPLVSNEDKQRLKSYHLKTGDLVFSRVGSVDRCSIISEKENGWLFSGRLLRVRFTKSIPSFFNYAFQLTETKQKVKNIAVGQTMPSINTEILKSIELSFPSIPEQQKIAAFLTAVDEKIQQLATKKKLLEQYKKGVMQKIFNQEIRFKDSDGNDFADWELTELKEIAVRVKDKNKSNEINKVLTNSATKGIVSQQDYFDKDIANQNNLEGYYIVEKDDFVYNPRISTSAPVGPIKRNNLEKGLMSPLYSVFRFREINLEFIEQFFETSLWHDYLKSIANYGARHDRMNITVEGFFEMPILLPTKPEQNKIANFLSAIDGKINLVSQQLEKTRSYKKGLLQQMFV